MLTDLRKRRDEIIETACARGATRVRVFGFVARGEATEYSDIFLVDLDDDRGLFDLGGLLMDLRDSSATTSTSSPRPACAPESPSACSPMPSAKPHPISRTNSDRHIPRTRGARLSGHA